MVFHHSIKDSVSSGILIFSLTLSFLFTVEFYSTTKILTPDFIEGNIILIALYAGLIAILLYAIPIYPFLIWLIIKALEKKYASKSSVTYYEVFNGFFFKEIRTKIETITFSIFSVGLVFLYTVLNNWSFFTGNNHLVGLVFIIVLLIILVILFIRFYLLIFGSKRLSIVSNRELLYDIRQYYIVRESSAYAKEISFSYYKEFLDKDLSEMDARFPSNIKAFREGLKKRYSLIYQHIALRKESYPDFKEFFNYFGEEKIPDFRAFGGKIKDYHRVLKEVDFESIEHFGVQSLGKKMEMFCSILENYVNQVDELSQPILKMNKLIFTTTGFERPDAPEKFNKVITLAIKLSLRDNLTKEEIEKKIIKKYSSGMFNQPDLDKFYEKVVGESVPKTVEDHYQFLVRWLTTSFKGMVEKKETCFRLLDEVLVQIEEIIGKKNKFIQSFR